MNDASRLAAVIVRLVAVCMVLVALVSFVMQLGIVLVRDDSQQIGVGTLIFQTTLGALLYAVPGIWLYRNSRELAMRLTKGLE